MAQCRMATKQQSATIRLDLTAEEFTMLKHWCIDHRLTMSKALSDCARKLMRKVMRTKNLSSETIVAGVDCLRRERHFRQSSE